MSKRKGLSFDEKKATLVSAMHAEASFYTLKELENLGKSKGVIPQSVKEVVEALCADGEVQSDKVGTQVLFWALPSGKASSLRTKKQRLDEDLNHLHLENGQLQAELANMSAQPQQSDEELASVRLRLAGDRQRRDRLKEQVAALERCGSENLAQMKTQTGVAKEAANRWADNICTLRALFLRERRGEVSTNDFNRTFELPEEFDFVE